MRKSLIVLSVVSLLLYASCSFDTLSTVIGGDTTGDNDSHIGITANYDENAAEMLVEGAWTDGEYIVRFGYDVSRMISWEGYQSSGHTIAWGPWYDRAHEEMYFTEYAVSAYEFVIRFSADGNSMQIRYRKGFPLVFLKEGVWKRIQYQVDFESDGNVALPSSQQIYNGYKGYVEEPENPVREGYTFTGWYYEDQLWDFDTDKVVEDMTLVAGWEPSLAEEEI